MFEKVNEVTPATVMLSAWLLSSSRCVLGKNSILLLGTEASGQVKEADSFTELFFFPIALYFWSVMKPMSHGC